MDLLPSLKTGAFILVCDPDSKALTALIAELALRGGLAVYDGGNRFAAYRVAQALRKQSLDVNNLARRIRLRRAFTCYQMVSLLESAGALPEPTIVLDLLAAFQDEQVKPREAGRLLDLCLAQIERLRMAAPLAVSVSPASIPEKAFLIRKLYQSASEVFTPKPQPLAAEQMRMF